MKIVPATDKSFAHMEGGIFRPVQEMPKSDAVHVIPRPSVMRGLSVRLSARDVAELPDDLRAQVIEGNVLKYE